DDNLAKAAAVLEQLTRDFPDIPEYRHDLCETYATDAPRGRRSRPEDEPDAEQRLRKAMDLSNRLVAEHPNVADYQTSQVHLNHKLARVLRDTDRPSETEECLRRALALQKSLVARFPDVSSYQTWLAVIQESLAKLLRDRRQLAEARTLLESSVALLEQQVSREPRDGPIHGLLKNQQEVLAEVVARMDEGNGSRSAPRRTGALRPNE
ncbi:MAG: tetratricopeptide repeat protein, partial [Pirellulales bacterium]|nr:tetratricopeptide repeat protein [Pirellulales bacterium]